VRFLYEGDPPGDGRPAVRPLLAILKWVVVLGVVLLLIVTAVDSLIVDVLGYTR
jgi:hypothetical protein